MQSIFLIHFRESVLVRGFGDIIPKSKTPYMRKIWGFCLKFSKKFFLFPQPLEGF